MKYYKVQFKNHKPLVFLSPRELVTDDEVVECALSMLEDSSHFMGLELAYTEDLSEKEYQEFNGVFKKEHETIKEKICFKIDEQLSALRQEIINDLKNEIPSFKVAEFLVYPFLQECKIVSINGVKLHPHWRWSQGEDLERKLQSALVEMEMNFHDFKAVYELLVSNNFKSLMVTSPRVLMPIKESHADTTFWRQLIIK